MGFATAAISDSRSGCNPWTACSPACTVAALPDPRHLANPHLIPRVRLLAGLPRNRGLRQATTGARAIKSPFTGQLRLGKTRNAGVPRLPHSAAEIGWHEPATHGDPFADIATNSARAKVAEREAWSRCLRGGDTAAPSTYRRSCSWSVSLDCRTRTFPQEAPSRNPVEPLVQQPPHAR